MRTRAFTTVGWEKYLVPTNPFVQNFLNKNGDDVLWQVALNIHNAIIDGKDSMGIIVHVNTPSVVMIEKKDYVTVLDYCNDWFVKKEMYERCALIQTYKTDFKNKSSRKKIDESRKQNNLI
jgi:GTPase